MPPLRARLGLAPRTFAKSESDTYHIQTIIDRLLASGL